MIFNDFIYFLDFYIFQFSLFLGFSAPVAALGAQPPASPISLQRPAEQGRSSKRTAQRTAQHTPTPHRSTLHSGVEPNKSLREGLGLELQH